MTLNTLEDIVSTYRIVSRCPTLTGARIRGLTPVGISIQSIWLQRNLERKLNQTFMRNHNVNTDLNLASENFAIDITNEHLSTVSKDEQLRAVLRQATLDGSSKQFIEIWDKQRIIKHYDLAALDVHGEVYTDCEFASFEWSPNRMKLVYVAEKKLPKSEPFYKQKSLSKTGKEKTEDTEITVGNEYVYKPHWGEQLVGKHRPVVAVLDICTDTIVVLPGIPDDLSPGQVSWTVDGEYIIGVAWKHEPRYLGLMVCTNRHSWIFMLKDGKFEKLSADGCAVRMPRLSPDGKYLIWLERKAGGPHHNAHRLMCLDLKSKEKKIDVLIDIVDTEMIINHGKYFYGLYGRLPRRCWSTDSRYIFFSTCQQSNICSYVFDTSTKILTQIESDRGSLSILDVKYSVIAFLETSLVTPSYLSVGHFKPEILNNGNIPRYALTTPLKLIKMENVMYDHTEYIYDNNDDIKKFNFTYLGAKSGDDKSLPLVVMPHGGPHTNFVNIFSHDYMVFALLGLPVLLVNYRGSTGMGSANVEYLQGKVGDTDVTDCVTATKEALRKYPWLDPARIGLSGGSHGGFLVTHLSGQHTDLYKAVVARNPVVDIAAMFSISDIPDWCAAAINHPYNENGDTEKTDCKEIFTKMLNCSPIVHVNKVKIPTLICVGTNDLRVPSSQGKLWYHRLKANNVKTRMLVYDDNHGLGSGTAEIDCLLNSYLWLNRHINEP